MKNYYEILEVDKNASEEVIEKAYKTLAKNIIQTYKIIVIAKIKCAK